MNRFAEAVGQGVFALLDLLLPILPAFLAGLAVGAVLRAIA